MNTQVILHKDVIVVPDIKTIGELYTQAIEKRIVVLSEWLQRLQQSRKWRANRGEKSNDFLYSFFKGNSLITPFYFISVDILEEYILNEISVEKNDTICLIYKEMIKDLADYKSKGAIYVLLDGQNRLFEAIVPFFKGELPSNDYKKSFRFTVDGLNVNINNFRWTDIDLDQRIKDEFYNTQVIVAEGVGGDIHAYIDSIVALNNGESWTKFETTIIRPVALSYKINRDIFHDPLIQSLFGNDIISGNVSSMSGAYEVQKKGDGRYMAELIYGIKNECRSGLGSEDAVCSMIMESDKPSLDAYVRVKSYLSFISSTLDCPKNSKLKETEKPLTKNTLRALVLLLDMMLNKTNTMYRDCPIKLKTLDNIKAPKTIFEEVIKWHNHQVNGSTNPVDFKDGKPLPGTYVFNNGGINPSNIIERLRFICKLVTDCSDEWINKRYIENTSIDYKSKELLLKKESGYKDPYSKTKPIIGLRDKVHVDHIRSKNKGGTNSIDNLQVTNAKSNLIKSDRY
jgi:hypothetical protein